MKSPVTYDEASRISMLFCIDENYVAPLATLLFSILDNAAPERCFEFNILGTALSPEARDFLCSIGQENRRAVYTILDMDETSKKLDLAKYEHGNWPKETLFRLFITTAFPEHSKMLYLDSDMLVADDVGKLWDMDISAYYAAVVPGSNDSPKILASRRSKFYPEMTSEEYTRNHLGKKNLRAFNAGMVLFNLDLMRADGKGDLLVPFLQEKFPLDLLDQDVLNAVLEEKLLYLDRRWNVCRNMLWYVDKYLPHEQEEIRAAHADPAIVHYTTKYKPWMIQFDDLGPVRRWWKAYYKGPCPGSRFPIVCRRGDDTKVDAPAWAGYCFGKLMATNGWIWRRTKKWLRKYTELLPPGKMAVAAAKKAAQKAGAKSK